jgi:hypothetical protein
VEQSRDLAQARSDLDGGGARRAHLVDELAADAGADVLFDVHEKLALKGGYLE